MPTAKSTVILRIVLSAAVVSVFSWAIFFYPKPENKRPKLSPEESRQLLDQSKMLLKDHKYQEALLPTQKLYQAYPDDHIYIEQMAEIYDQMHQYKDEAEYWEKYRQHAPRPIAACPQIGMAYQKEGLSKEALAAFEWCLSLDPANSDSIYNLAHALERDGQYDRAAELYQRGLQLSPNYTDLQVGLARAQIHQDKLALAEESASNVLKQSPENTDALFVLGMAYYRGGDLVKARLNLEKGVKKADEDTDFHLLLGKIAEKEKKIPEAIEHYTRAAELSPNNKEIRAQLDELKAMK